MREIVCVKHSIKSKLNQETVRSERTDKNNIHNTYHLSLDFMTGFMKRYIFYCEIHIGGGAV